jgi:hypothetical protein
MLLYTHRSSQNLLLDYGLVFFLAGHVIFMSYVTIFTPFHLWKVLLMGHLGQGYPKFLTCGPHHFTGCGPENSNVEILYI